MSESTVAIEQEKPMLTLYVRNLNDKIKTEGITLIFLSHWSFRNENWSFSPVQYLWRSGLN